MLPCNLFNSDLRACSIKLAARTRTYTLLHPAGLSGGVTGVGEISLVGSGDRRLLGALPWRAIAEALPGACCGRTISVDGVRRETFGLGSESGRWVV